MKILIAIGVARQREAGAAGVVLNQTRELRKRGHEVDCWFLNDVLQRPARPRRLEALIFAISVARRILKDKKKYDVVNLHAPWGCAYGIWHKIYRSAGAPPYVMTMQGSEERYVEAMRQEYRIGRAWNFGWKNRLWHRLYHQTMYDCSIRMADYGAVANSEAASSTESKYKRDPDRIFYVPNGTEEHFFASHEYSAGQQIHLLFVGTWLDRKGVYYLADSFCMLAKKMPDVRLTIAGCLSSEVQVKSFFAPDVRERICVRPFVKREDMPALYAEHDIFVFPSLVEGMPLTLLEAMAAGMPAVTADTCGMADVVKDEINGFLVPPADATRLANAIERLCSSAELRKKLGENAQQSMRQYTWDKVSEKLERVLLLAVHGRRS